MAGGGKKLGQDVKQVNLNFGCGEEMLSGFINVDKYGTPEVKHDLDVFPYPFVNDYADYILLCHVLEHLDDWLKVLKECYRILKTGGILDIAVPDSSDTSALAYYDHKHVFNFVSISTILFDIRTGNSWAEQKENKLNFNFVSYTRVPMRQYKYWPRFIIDWCMDHLNNFACEQMFILQKR